MDTIEEISVFDIMNKYHLDYDYAQNILNHLSKLRYIKPVGNSSYILMLAEPSIDSYIKSYVKDLSPSEYIPSDIKSNKKHPLISKIRSELFYLGIVVPLFIRRLFFSIPQGIIILYAILNFAYVDKTVTAFFTDAIIFYVIIGIPLNVVIRIFQSRFYKMRFRDFMLLENNWFFKRIKNNFEITRLLHPNKKIIFLKKYDLTINELTTILQRQSELAAHYASIANNASTEKEFFTSISCCLEILEWMSQFEKYNVFVHTNTPSNDIADIKNGMSASINRLHNRMDPKDILLNTSDLKEIDTMDGRSFEFYCADILLKNGFVNVEVTRSSNDHGTDIFAEKDDISYAIQCKCYSSNIGNTAVQQAHSGKGFYHKDIAVVLTNQYFTAQAKEEADALGVKLWDRKKLEEFIRTSSTI